MHWFLNTYLPGILYYVVIPTLVGIAYACAMQFEYRRRLLKAHFGDEDDEGEPVESVASLSALAANAEESSQFAAAPEELSPADAQVVPEEVVPEPESVPQPKQKNNPLDKMLDSMITGSFTQPEAAPGFLDSLDAEVEKSLDFFAKQEENRAVDFDEALAMGETFAEDRFAAELAPIDLDENFSGNAGDDPFGQDLAAAILGSTFKFDDLGKSNLVAPEVVELEEAQLDSLASPAVAKPAKRAKPPKVADAFTQQMAAIPLLEQYRRPEDVSREAILSCTREHLATADAMLQRVNLPQEMFAPIETAPLITIPPRRKSS